MCRRARPRGTTSVVHLKVNSIALPLAGDIVRTLRRTMSSRTMSRAFGKCKPRRKCTFTRRTVTSCCTHGNMRMGMSSVFVSSKTGDSAKGVARLFTGSGIILIPSPICPICMSAGAVSKGGVVCVGKAGRGSFLPVPSRGMGTSVVCLYSPGGPAKTYCGGRRLRT